MTEHDIADIAELAAFYRNNEGWYRMMYTDLEEGFFQCLNEDTGEEYRIEFSEVNPQSDTFWELKPIAWPVDLLG
jgi:hypothetical protein